MKICFSDWSIYAGKANTTSVVTYESSMVSCLKGVGHQLNTMYDTHTCPFPQSMLFYYTLKRQLFITAFCLLPMISSHADEIARFHQFDRAGYLVIDRHGEMISQFRADEPYVPASTVKLLTAYLCLRYWGEHHRFTTLFFIDESISRLWVLAGGDPFLVSEEIGLIAHGLAEAGITSVQSIGLDTSMFSPDLVVPGATTTDNPYDAVPSALAANFNTVNIERKGNLVLSAESQTPLTPIATETGQIFAEDGKKRVNLGKHSRRSEHYFAELLLEQLKVRGVATGSEVVWGRVPEGIPVYVHRNTRTLGEVLQGMLKYSTNFIANQLLLALVAEQTRTPVDFSQVRLFLQKSLTELFGWKSFNLLEGAGLSADNRLSARQIVDVLQHFTEWRHLLPEVSPGVIAKTGTLTMVKSLAGYSQGADGHWRTFAVLVNESVSRDLPTRAINALVE